jgi:hypothetical protein
MIGGGWDQSSPTPQPRGVLLWVVPARRQYGDNVRSALRSTDSATTIQCNGGNPVETSGTNQVVVKRLIGVYDADGSLAGELKYWIGAKLGSRHCSLCDITHGGVRESSEWKSCRAQLPVEFTLHHRDDAPLAIREILNGAFPSVLVEVEHGISILLGPGELDECQGSPIRLERAINSSMEKRGFSW